MPGAPLLRLVWTSGRPRSSGQAPGRWCSAASPSSQSLAASATRSRRVSPRTRHACSSTQPMPAAPSSKPVASVGSPPASIGQASPPPGRRSAWPSTQSSRRRASYAQRASPLWRYSERNVNATPAAPERKPVYVVAADALGQGARRSDQLLEVRRPGGGVALEASAVQAPGEDVERVDDAGRAIVERGEVRVVDAAGVVVVRPAQPALRRLRDGEQPVGGVLGAAQVAPLARRLVQPEQAHRDAGGADVAVGLQVRGLDRAPPRPAAAGPADVLGQQLAPGGIEDRAGGDGVGGRGEREREGEAQRAQHRPEAAERS